MKIADFGLAKLLGADREDSELEKPFTLTGTRQIVGTLHYMAPEQMQGSSAVDHRADIYSLGVVFYEMLTGELPIGRFEPPSKKVQIDVRLDEVVLRTLESTPDRRYQHASEVKTEVESIAGDDDTRSPAAEPDTAEAESLVRSRLKVPAIGLLVAGIVNVLATLSIVLISVGGSEDLVWRTVLIKVVALCSLVLGIVLLIGSAGMRDLQSYPIALSAAVAAVLPLAPGFLISLPFGIWALILLSRRDVRTTFAGESEREQRKERSDSAVGGTMVFGLSLGVALGAVMDNIPVYLTLGMVLGILVGYGIDMNNRRESKD